MEKSSEKLRVVDFFCGIGGLSVALELLSSVTSQTEFEFAHAFDASDSCTKLYKTNFPNVKAHHRSIDHLSKKDFEELKCDIWLLSPPCQPFTSGGKQLGEDDPRCAALIHIITILDELTKLPSLIFLENVPQFAESSLRTRLLETLEKRRFDFQEYVISPTAIGCPNSRSRYYLLAWRRSVLEETRQEKGEPRPDILEKLPLESLKAFGYEASPPVKKMGNYLEYYEDSQIGWRDQHDSSVATTDGSYGLHFKLEELIVPEKRIRHLSGIKFDIASADSQISSTFTGGYGQLIAKSGPVLELVKINTAKDEESGQALKKRKINEETGNDPESGRFGVVDPDIQKVRHFSPTEVMRIHGFPASYKVPETYRCRKLWSLLGNSVNVDVVKVLMHHLCANETTNINV